MGALFVDVLRSRRVDSVIISHEKSPSFDVACSASVSPKRFGAASSPLLIPYASLGDRDRARIADGGGCESRESAVVLLSIVQNKPARDVVVGRQLVAGPPAA